MTGAPPAGVPLLGIVGPTASGKSALAMALALRLPLEVVVADSRQVFRGMDVGTAKPDRTARAEVPHHQLDLLDPDEPFSVAQWVEGARRVIGEIWVRGRLPVVVGGTGLYVAALVDGHDYAEAPWDPALRARLDEQLAAEGLAPLVERLAVLDPGTAARTDLDNPRRVLRALERAAGGGGEPTTTPYPGRISLVALDRPRAILYRRIDERAHWMFTEGGLLDEVRRLLDAGYAPDLRPMSGHGYAEAARHLSGEWSLDRAIEVTARRTRQYAKRQLSWFRRDPRIAWISAGDDPADAPAILEDVVARAAQLAEDRPID
jgi:tRNA dimethylallyltransferase